LITDDEIKDIIEDWIGEGYREDMCMLLMIKAILKKAQDNQGQHDS
jgi:hypothetical protein